MCTTYTRLRIVHAVDDAVAAAPSGTQTGELAAQSTAEPVGILRQRTEDELEAGRPDLLGQSSDVSFGASRDADVAPGAHPEV